MAGWQLIYEEISMLVAFVICLFVSFRLKEIAKCYFLFVFSFSGMQRKNKEPPFRASLSICDVQHRAAYPRIIAWKLYAK